MNLIDVLETGLSKELHTEVHYGLFNAFSYWYRFGTRGEKRVQIEGCSECFRSFLVTFRSDWPLEWQHEP